MKNAFGDLLVQYQTDLGSEIVNIASPQTTDESYFGVLNSQGVMKVYNYTIIESQQSYAKYIRDNFNVRRYNESRSEDEIAGTP